MRPGEWTAQLSAALELRLDETLDDIVQVATKLAEGQGPAVSAAAEIAAVSIKLRLDAEPLALWLADTVLAYRLV